MTQEEIAQKIEALAKRLLVVATLTTKAHNLEKKVLVANIKKFAGMVSHE